MGFKMRHRRPAERRQVDPVQRADPDGGGAGGELSVLHHRAERRRRGRARRAARRAGRDRRARRRSSRRGSTSSTSPAWCAAPPRARGWATSSSPTSATATPSPTSLRCFEDDDVTHVEGRIDPVADLEIIETELMLADLESLEKRVVSLEKKAKGGDKEATEHPRPASSARSSCCARAGRPALVERKRRGGRKAWRMLQLLTVKPALYVCNVDEALGRHRATPTPRRSPSAAAEEGAKAVVDLGPDRERDRPARRRPSGPSSSRPWA